MSYTGLEEVVVLKNQLNVVDWQVNEHTGDFWRSWADQLGDKLVEHGTDLLLVVGVLRDDSWLDHIGGHHVPLVNGQLLRSLSLLSNLLVHLLHLGHLLGG